MGASTNDPVCTSLADLTKRTTNATPTYPRCGHTYPRRHISSRQAPSQRQSGLHKPVQPSINSKKNSRLRWRAGHSALAACAWQADQRSKLAMHQSKRRTKRTHPSGTYRGSPSTTHGSGGAWAPSSIAWCSAARQCCGSKGDQHRHTKCTAAIWVAMPRGPLHRPPSGHHPCHQHRSHQAELACTDSSIRHPLQGCRAFPDL